MERVKGWRVKDINLYGVEEAELTLVNLVGRGEAELAQALTDQTVQRHWTFYTISFGIGS